jgi:hypothetical protein
MWRAGFSPRGASAPLMGALPRAPNRAVAPHAQRRAHECGRGRQASLHSLARRCFDATSQRPLFSSQPPSGAWTSVRARLQPRSAAGKAKTSRALSATPRVNQTLLPTAAGLPARSPSLRISSPATSNLRNPNSQPAIPVRYNPPRMWGGLSGSRRLLVGARWICAACHPRSS